MAKADVLRAVKELGKGEYRDGSSVTPGYTYHELVGGEFNYVSKHKGHARGEFDAITEHLKHWNGKTVLDVGCNVGFHTISAAMSGAVMVDGYEADSRNAKVARLLASHHEDKDAFRAGVIRIYTEPFTEEALFPGPFDVCLMLNVHMWLEKALGQEGCRSLMRKLSARAGRIYFQTAHAESEGMHLIKRLRNQSDISEYLIDCGFRSPEMIRSTREHGGKRLMFFAEGASA